MIKTVSDELLDDIVSGRCSVNDNVRKISNQWLEVASCIPPSFFQLCEMLEGMIPDCVHPLCDSVIAHIMIRNNLSQTSLTIGNFQTNRQKKNLSNPIYQ